MESSGGTGVRRWLSLVGAAVIATLVVLAGTELVFCAAWSVGRRLHPDALRAERSPAYAGAAWVPELTREQAMRLAAPYRYVPFRISGVAEWHGKYFNNDAHPTGVWRRTANPDTGCGPKTKVWIFGGSTVYGTGVPDWATLASYLSKEMNRQGRACVEVTNFGDESYVSTQELLLLIEQVKRGGRPEVVIFYDGFNDAHVGMTEADAWSAHYGLETIRARAEGRWEGRLDFLGRRCTARLADMAWQMVRQRGGTASDEAMRAKAMTVVDNYQANEQVARALAEAYHFKFYGFWQPMLFAGHKPLDSFERQIAEFDAKSKSRFDARPVVLAYEEAERRAEAGGFVSLTGVFDGVPQAVYIDEAHLGPRGNELVANAIAKYVEEHEGAN